MKALLALSAVTVAFAIAAASAFGGPMYAGGGGGGSTGPVIPASGPTVSIAPSPTVPATSSGSSFTWSDAGVLAGATIGGVLLLAVSVLVVVRRRERLAI